MVLKITSYDGSTVSVDVTNANPKLSIRGSNPISIIPPPNPDTASDTAYSNINTMLMNLKMLTVRVQLDFITKDGIGDVYALSTKATTASKLLYLFQTDVDKKRIYINTSTNYSYCHIMSYSCTEVAGQKGIVNHSLDLVLASSDSP